MTSTRNKTYTVSELNSDIKRLLENKFPFVWISGEISNFRMPASGHYYFTLKDDKSQVSCVMFRYQNRVLKFIPEDGMKTRGMGRISLYEPRGTYQIIFEHMEPHGAGELQRAFEQLKLRLSQEGLFDESLKKPLPFLPERISVVASPTGAVIHDIITTAGRRHPGVRIRICPARVQGEGAEGDVAAGIELLNQRADSDVIIVARGGGSLEDLAAFNSERVARAIFASEIPVISAVGHETDYTIADFTADLRAPTPSVAAELAVPVKRELAEKVLQLGQRCRNAALRSIDEKKRDLSATAGRLGTPLKMIHDLRLKTDDLLFRLQRNVKTLCLSCRERLQWRAGRFTPKLAETEMTRHKARLERAVSALAGSLDLKTTEIRLQNLNARLAAANPEAVIMRGYSMVTTVPGGEIVRRVDQAKAESELDIKVSDGVIRCRVKGKNKNDSKKNHI